MNIGQVRYFVTTYEEGSFSCAARKLLVTVQATSKAIADLEREIGGALFERRSRGVEPTALGAALYCKAAPVLRGFDELEAFARDPQAAHAAPPQALELALCSPRFVGYEHVFANISKLIKQHVDVDTRVRLAASSEGVDLLRSGEVDALITIGAYEDPAVDCVPLLQAPSGVCVTEGHPLGGKKEVSLDDLSDYPIVVAPEADLTRLIYELFRERGFDRECERVVENDAFVDAFVRRQGVMFCVGLPALSDDSATVIPVCREDALPVPICFVSLKERKTPAYLAAERFLTAKSRLGRS